MSNSAVVYYSTSLDGGKSLQLSHITLTVTESKLLFSIKLCVAFLSLNLA
jgi:hypothetical protein